MIAHKFKITNPQDYGLYTLENGEGKGLTCLASCKLINQVAMAHI